jgi:hypothetical protein
MDQWRVIRLRALHEAGPQDVSRVNINAVKWPLKASRVWIGNLDVAVLNGAHERDTTYHCVCRAIMHRKKSLVVKCSLFVC